MAGIELRMSWKPAKRVLPASSEATAADADGDGSSMIAGSSSTTARTSSGRVWARPAAVPPPSEWPTTQRRPAQHLLADGGGVGHVAGEGVGPRRPARPAVAPEVEAHDPVVGDQVGHRPRPGGHGSG